MSPLTILLVQGQLKELLSTYFTHVSAVYTTFEIEIGGSKLITRQTCVFILLFYYGYEGTLFIGYLPSIMVEIRSFVISQSDFSICDKDPGDFY